MQKKQIKKSLELKEKVINRKGNKLYVQWKGHNSSFNNWIDKKRNSINESDLSNYVKKEDLINATVVDTSKSTKKVDLANSKTNVDKLDIDKLKNVSTNLSHLKSRVNK